MSPSDPLANPPPPQRVLVPGSWILESSRPIIFDGGQIEGEYFYWIGATSFLCRWHGHYYVVTAGHALKDVRDVDVLVFPSDDVERSIGFSTIYRPVGRTDREYTDLAILQVAETEENRAWMGWKVPAPELSGVGILDFQVGDRLIVSGFPNEKRVPDYELKRLPSQRYTLGGTYVGVLTEHTHTLRMDTTADLESFDGFSGSPVYLTRGDRMVFAGVAVRGPQKTAAADQMHFIDALVLQTALEMVRTGGLPYT